MKKISSAKLAGWMSCAPSRIRRLEGSRPDGRLCTLNGVTQVQRLAQVTDAGMVRIHRSVVVNVAHIVELRQCVTGVYLVRVSGGKKYTITRTYKNNLRFLADIWLSTEI